MNPPFPFTELALQRALREFLGTSQVQALNLRQVPGPAVIPGNYGDTAGLYQQTALVADLLVEGRSESLSLAWHQAPQATIEREHGFYTKLAQNISVAIVGFIAGEPTQGWLLLEGLDALQAPSDWQPDHYREAMQNLAKLHHFGWRNTDNLEMFEFLWQPLGSDYYSVYTGTVKPAAYELTSQTPHLLLKPPHYLALFGFLETYFQDMSKHLKSEVQTLLHGSYWPGNIALQRDSSQIMTHWQYVSLGPAILDVVMFHQSTASHLPSAAMPPWAAVELYREYLEGRVGESLWDNPQWEQAWDHALLWLFAVHWLARLARMSPEAYPTIHERMERVWYKPLAKALLRQFGVELPPA